MSERDIAAYIVPSSDPHQSEYVAEHYTARTFITGFTGSAGTAITTLDEAILWTDGKVISQEYFTNLKKSLESKGYSFEVNEDLIDKIWEDRPERSCTQVILHDVKYAGA